MSKDSKNNVLVKQLEFLFWLLILLIIICWLSFSNIYNKKRTDDYTIFMQDIDGLIVGSPVRMLGIEIGYITKIKPENSEIVVNFIVNNKNVKIPIGSKVSVEFSGLGGSKSLEIYPPENSNKEFSESQITQDKNPRRLNDSLSLLSEMLDKLSTIISTATIFGNKIQKIEYNIDNKNELYNLIDTSEIVIKKIVDLKKEGGHE